MAGILGELRALRSLRERTGLPVIEFRECGECERGLFECTGLMETPRVFISARLSVSLSSSRVVDNCLYPVE
jgi:hypothetical protein